MRNSGDPFVPVQVCPRRVKLLVVSAGVRLQPGYVWETVEPRIAGAVQAAFSFDARELGQPASLSEAIAVMQSVEGVLYVDVQVFDSVSEEVNVKDLSQLVTTLKPRDRVLADLARIDPAIDPADPSFTDCRRIRAAELLYLTPDIPATLILNQIGA
jgi:hypothetical protein